MTKREIAQAFSMGQFDKCFDFLTHQSIWNTPGEQNLLGRAQIEPFCKNIRAYFNSVTTDFKQLNLIESNQHVVINGTAAFIRENKIVSRVSSCDVYEFGSNNTIVSIYSYCIKEPIEQQNIG